MKERIGKRDVDKAFLYAAQAAQLAGLNTDGWAVHHGSPLNGISWTLQTGQGGSAVVSLPSSFGIIGKSAREAWTTLRVLEAAWRSIENAKATGYGWTGDAK